MAEDDAQAGAQSRQRAAFDAAALLQQNLAVRRDARAEERAGRMEESQSLNDEVQRWEFEKKKTLDANATALKIETDKQAIEANQELFKIRTDHPDADAQLADWGVKYFRVLDDKMGDPRLIRQFQINQNFVEQRKAREARAAEISATKQAAADERQANTEASGKLLQGSGFKQSGASIGAAGTIQPTFKAQESPEERIKALDQRLNTEYGIGLAYFNQPGANTGKARIENGKAVRVPADQEATHIAVDVTLPDGKTTTTRTIPIETFNELKAVYDAARNPSSGKPKAVVQNGITYTLQPDGSYK